LPEQEVLLVLELLRKRTLEAVERKLANG